MTSLRIAVLVLLAVATVAEAQRGGGGRRRGTAAPNYDQLVNEDRGERGAIAKREMEFMNPTKLLLDKRRALTLTDSQVTSLRALDGKLAAMNDTLFTQLDSLRRELKPTNLAPQVERMRTRGVMRSLAGVVQAIRANYNAIADEAVPLLNETQQKTANELLDKQEADGDKMLQERLGGGRRGG